ncbi:MAG: DNA polymerase I, partial [Candidatus Marinimicrobia bacterium]|nr:DNA polymerase I [Candidatus Neomarinimicrobiota bacterium]
MKDKPTLYLIDGSAIAYRSYFGMIRNRLTTSNGQPTGATYAFVKSLLKIINERKPDYLGMVFDAPEKTFRHKIYPDYKATREAMPDDLVSQLPQMFKITEAMNIPVIISPGYEADDIIGTLALEAKKKGISVFMVTGDKDFMQLLGDDIYMYKPASGQKEVEIISSDKVVEKWGVRPDQIADYLGLVGDSSDNIPGVKGIGPAKARPLLQEYGTVEGVIENLDKIENARVANMLKEGSESAKFSKMLATIKTDISLDVSIDNLKSSSVNKSSLNEIFEELEFFTLIKSFQKSEEKEKPEKKYKTISTLSELK